MRRAVITGIGAVTPLGVGVAALFEAFRAGRSGLSLLEGIPIARGKNLSGQVKDEAFGPPNRLYKMAVAAIEEALAASGAELTKPAGLYLATFAADSRDLENLYSAFCGVAPSVALLEAMTGYPNGFLADRLAARFAISGPRDVNTNACASGNVALARALTAIRLGEVSCAIVCGCEQLKPTMYWGAERAGLVGHDLRPFHRDRDGTIFGEGAGALIIEELETARRRGATLIAELAGWGVACDDNPHFILPQLDGSANARGLERALRDAGVPADEVDYFNAHGTGTINIDRTEVLACKRIFGPHAAEIPISATKSLTGHMSGASPIIEAIACIMAITQSYIHPTAKLDILDPLLDLDFVPLRGRAHQTRVAISNSMGGGGTNAAVVLSHPNLIRSVRPDPICDDVVITGTSLLSPDGQGVASLSDRLMSERATGPAAATIDWLDVDEIIRPPSTFRYLNRCGQLAAAAAFLAAQQARLPDSRCDPARLAVIFGTMFGGTTTWSDLLCGTFQRDPRHITPNMALEHGHHLGVTLAARLLNAKGPNCTLTGGTVSGAQAIGFAYDLLRLDVCDAVVVGGADIIDEPLLHALDLVRASGAQLDRRFPDRMTEICSCVVLERRARAIERGARPLARLSGFGSSAAPVGVLGVDESGQSLQMAVERALGEIRIADPFGMIQTTSGSSLREVESAVAERTLPGSANCMLRLGDTLGETLAAAGPLGLTLAAHAVGHVAPWWRTPDQLSLPDVPPSAVIVTTMALGGNAAALAVTADAA